MKHGPKLKTKGARKGDWTLQHKHHLTITVNDCAIKEAFQNEAWQKPQLTFINFYD